MNALEYVSLDYIQITTCLYHKYQFDPEVRVVFRHAKHEHRV
jgi:hypothetical protein